MFLFYYEPSAKCSAVTYELSGHDSYSWLAWNAGSGGSTEATLDAQVSTSSVTTIVTIPLTFSVKIVDSGDEGYSEDFNLVVVDCSSATGSDLRWTYGE